MAARVHLVRHGEVHDPDHLVYASLPGFGLSQLGVAQARSAARYLGRQPIVAVWSSPLERAIRTAEPIAGRVGQPVRVEEALREWALMDRWSGTSWDDLPRMFPGELEAFLADPTDLSFAPESLEELSARLTSAIRALDVSHRHGEVVVVSHSATVRTATLGLTGAPLSAFWDVEPAHASVTTLRPGPNWTVEANWAPDPGLLAG